MARFRIEGGEDRPDRIHILVDGIFQLAIVRTPEGIVIDVYPKDWDYPLETFTVWDDDIAAASDDGVVA